MQLLRDGETLKRADIMIVSKASQDRAIREKVEKAPAQLKEMKLNLPNNKTVSGHQEHPHEKLRESPRKMKQKHE